MNIILNQNSLILSSSDKYISLNRSIEKRAVVCIRYGERDAAIQSATQSAIGGKYEQKQRMNAICKNACVSPEMCP